MDKIEDIDRIAPVFKNRHVLITGGTGFLGLLFIEKLLRVTEVGKIYVVIRGKRGLDPKDRAVKMLEDPLFDKLKTQMGVSRILDKFVIISGDCSLLQAGISDQDRQIIIDNVSFVYHLCANIRFDEALKTAVETNTRGTREIIELALQCKKLDLFVYVSTCYCHLKEKILYEKSYPPPKDPHQIIKLVEGLSVEEAEKHREEVLDFYPNTYAFTKALAEGLVNEARDKRNLKALLIRPSIIVSTLDDPIQGWTNNLNGLTGLMVAYGRGAMRTLHCDGKYFGDFMPVDVCVSGLMVSTWNYVANNDKKRSVLNFATSNSIGRYSYKELLEISQNVVLKEYPFNALLWYPQCKLTSSTVLHKIRAVYKHWIPALLIDALLTCFGFKPLMMHVHKKLAKGMEVLDYYTNNVWEFDNTQSSHVFGLVNSVETKKYYVEFQNFTREQLEWSVRTNILGARRYLLNEPDETLPSARRLMKIMYVLDLIVTTAVYGFLIYLFVKFMVPVLDNHQILASFSSKLNDSFSYLI